MYSFLKQTAKSIIEQIGWANLSKTTIVLPSHRAGLTLKDELMLLQQADNQSAVYAPHVTTISQLFDDLCPLHKEDEFLSIVRLYRCYLEKNAGEEDLMTLDMFYGWGKQMLADFTNIDASMHAEEVPNFFDNAIAANELDRLNIDEELEHRLKQLFGEKDYSKSKDYNASVRRKYESVWQNLYELYKALREQMDNESKGYSGMRQRRVIEEWESENIQKEIHGRTFVFVGFNYLLPVEYELMVKLKETTTTYFYWDYVADFQTNKKAFSFAIENSDKKKLGSASKPLSLSEPKQIDVYSCSSREVQAQYVHQWLLDNYTQEGERVGVVICDESMLEPVIYTLPSITLPGKNEPTLVNITKGFPLKNTQIYADVLSWLNNTENGKSEDVVSTDFIDKLIAALFPKKGPNDEDEESNEPTGMAWQDLLQLESEYQIRLIINQIRKLISDGLGEIPLTLKLVRLLIRRRMEEVSMPFHGEPICDIQVMGVLETRMLDFDKLLLLNVEEGVVPQSKADFSFIPYYLRKYYHMQTNDERATVYAYNFFRLLSRAGQITMLFSNTGGVDNSKGMSRFIMQMLTSPQEFNVRKFRLKEENILGTKSLLDEERKPLIEALQLQWNENGQLVYPEKDGKVKPYTLSPSALNTYITCPYKFYLEKIKGRQEPEKEETGLPVNVIGTLVHNTMEAIYKELGCKSEEPVEITAEQLAPYKEKEKLEKMLKMAYDALNEDQKKRQKTQRYCMDDQDLDNPKILQFVINLIDNDLRTIEAEGLQIWKLEQPYYVDLPIFEKEKIQIGGRIDRVDICGHKLNKERIRIVDYKTGSYTEPKSNWQDFCTPDGDGKIRQTLIYSHVLKETLLKEQKDERPIQPNLFFCNGDMTDRISVVRLTEEPPKQGRETNEQKEASKINNFAEVQDKVLDQLKSKVAELLKDSTFPQCEEDKCDRYCAFFEICGRKKPESFN